MTHILLVDDHAVLRAGMRRLIDLVFSMEDDPRYVREAFSVGANGYVLKEAVDTEVIGAIRDVAAGARYVHPELGARLVAAETEARKRAGADPLSEREHEVLVLLARGFTIRRSRRSCSSRSELQKRAGGT